MCIGPNIIVTFKFLKLCSDVGKYYSKKQTTLYTKNSLLLVTCKKRRTISESLSKAIDNWRQPNGI